MSTIILNCTQLSQRLSYVCQFIWNENLEYNWSFQQSESTGTFTIKLIDGTELYTLPNWGILDGSDISNEICNIYTGKIKSLSKNLEDWKNYDIFGIIFFLLSRYEEYVIESRDGHGRFTSDNSVMRKADCLLFPMVDYLLNELKKSLQNNVAVDLITSDVKLISTIDVDHPWYYKHLKFPFSLKHLFWKSEDPYDTYEKINQAHHHIGCQPIYFFLTGGRSSYEKINRYDRTAYAELIRRMVMNQDIQVGVHPSYHSATDPDEMAQSIHKFKELSERDPQASRQHYLRLKLPDTYRMLIEHNMKSDYTMGFADHIGFRAGTSRRFQWFDLLKNESTSLRITPLLVMDVTLKNYMKLSPIEARIKLEEMKRTIGQYGGNFTILWHNSSLSKLDDWEGYDEMYFEFIRSFHPTLS